jgi:hypothetical protein
MRKFINKVAKKAKAFLIESWHFNFAPYTVINSKTGKYHYAWKWSDALEWMACYSAKHFGVTKVVDRRGEFVASNG